MIVDAAEPPNGMRLSCGAVLERSQTNDYPKERGADSFRRMLGGAPARDAEFATEPLEGPPITI